ncbi:hypothetical protein HPB50_017315 [Hyalomma asiaticum]|uniref:Uncharacterized protein n=1 Tax=Hyalomma asiaticum TaxID=266040 RepID=A0ACB7TK35_HYAAI|nr:hypothetical protein HPB50_017315 [Hyalomma asiaticum]
MQLCIHNTLEEIIEAQDTPQTAKFTSVAMDGSIVATLWCCPAVEEERYANIISLRNTGFTTRSLLFPGTCSRSTTWGDGGPGVRMLRIDAARYGRSANFSAVTVEHRFCSPLRFYQERRSR